ncbi:MAG: tRNA preQ1(34) S-adenosylmethionine ribosyltransferase-isomerase QueA [Gammaproteobacteria bacterium CG_4_10_14_0_8_um_filter_38_16]|nr:MAG: tRNA preQ1(34) S-adenosylmethionine ribosyltransferase-isomerase QueA [Gammaproteobacteria bacterium CG_4_10_14_0_8_um_filter_38_16]PJA03396.1 MAG: tRNA preQ1(34) S-adenosylmethionine ribosyltransferase-isomerase QueA [Gammaproteobacteria bacterium CG_4_10_14_0_2_um_filter_38_22]PJB11132.1 MAG: tRNA preQ1(34) S-adenosylmethionine ribosyltransferase-isomerase QueA [Gammaproteobacteria bacterium CG_4_9_14_3_um_filter_38_9]
MYTVSDFDYALPDALIAQFPTQKRTESRLLVVPEKSDDFRHVLFPELLADLNPADLVIFNDTRVMNARLFGKKASGGKIECLIERVLDDHTALAHIKASHAPLVDSELILESVLHATVIARQGALFVLQFSNEESIAALLSQHGHLPLPPYIARDVKENDLERYQTVYSKNMGAVAAPTAGLHFDDLLLQTMREKKIEMGFVTLHVGAGTFQPVRVDHLSDHVMHSEQVTVSATLCEQIKACRVRGGRVIAVGTTVVRSLESAAISGEIAPFCGDTRLFITPGFQFRVVDMLLTNFHLPKSTLLMLVCAFAGFDRVMHAYAEAVAKQYRFFSYGDAMLLYKC